MKLLCITKCPTGMVQTYVAAEQLESAAEALGYEIRTGTHGAQGIGGEFTPEQIDEADYVIIASNTEVEKTTRFGNKKLLVVPLEDATNNAESVLGRVLEESETYEQSKKQFPKILK